MKRITIFLIFLLGISSVCCAQNIKHGKLKLDNGIYQGDYLRDSKPGTLYSSVTKLPHGNGIMHYSNGDTFDGEWKYGKPRRGTYTYNDGSKFIGGIGLDGWKGSLLFKNDHTIEIGLDSWLIKAGNQFSGKIKSFSKIIEEGEFSNEITNTRGDIFCGNIKNKELADGKYYYAQTTTLNNGWTIPAGCTFNGNIKSFSGTVDAEIINAAGDKYIGELKNGKPHGQGELLNASGDRYSGSFRSGLPDGQCTVVFADGRTESGIWRNGQSPSEYEAVQKLYAELCLAKFDKYFKKEIEERRRKDLIYDFVMYFSDKYKYLIAPAIPATPDVKYGAYLRLKQMFCGKKFIRLKDDVAVFESSENKNKEEKIYECIDITDDKIILKSETGETIKRCIYSFSVDSEPDKKLSEYVPYPHELNGVYQYYELYIYNPNPSFENDKYSIYPLADRELSKKRTTDFFIRKYGAAYGMAVANRVPNMGMTIEMIEDMFGPGTRSRYLSNNTEIVTITYGGGYDLVFGFRKSSTEYTFVNNKLTKIYSY